MEAQAHQQQQWMHPSHASAATVSSMASAQPYTQPTSVEEVRTLWIGDLQYWVDENYLHSCFAHTGEVISIKIIRNKITGQPEGYGFVEFVSHAAAERILQAYNGTQMPGTEQTFRLNWASFGIGERRPDAGPEHSIFVGDLAPDVTDYLLQETFRAQYPSVRGAKVVTDPNTGRTKGYGFVKFSDEMERNRAMTEMNGVYCSTRPMRISAATPKKTTGFQQQYAAAAKVEDLLLVGGSYTWCGGLNNRSASRLDRFLVSEDWESHFSNLSQSLLPKPTSDHAPILLDGGGISGKKNPFLLRKYVVESGGLHRPSQEVVVFGNVSLNKNVALSQIGLWDAKERDCGLSLEDSEARRRVVEEFSKWAVLEEISWRKLTEETEMKEGVVNAFQNILSEKRDWRPSISGLPFSFLDSVQAGLIEDAFSMEEVQTAVFGLNGDKAPGPGGSGRSERSLNSTFIVLIPKKGCTDDLKDFRPISLVGSLYKILAKVLANRLKRVVGNVISNSQHAFVEGFFQSSRGLRQGDPLSPFLFILAMEALSSILKRASQGGFLEGFMAGGRGGEGVRVCHLLFADDTLVFCDASKERVEVSLRLEKIQRDFLWGGGASQSKPHLVNWCIVCMEKKDGGLGIRNLSRLNKAFLGKWCWRFASEQDSLWKQVIVRKFGEEDGHWCPGDSRESHGVGLWKVIRNGWMEFSKRVDFKLRDGRGVRFWKDRWCGEDSLEEAFPRLYSLASSKDAWRVPFKLSVESLGSKESQLFCLGGYLGSVDCASWSIFDFIDWLGSLYPAPAYTTPPLQALPADNDINNTTIFVGNLDPNVTEEELKQIFSQFGELVYVKIPAGRGCGFVQFGTRTSAEEAIQRMQGTVIGQLVVRISWGRSPTAKQDLPGSWGQQADPSQWSSAYYGYGQGYDAYPYGATQDPSLYAYGAYAGCTPSELQEFGFHNVSAALHVHSTHILNDKQLVHCNLVLSSQSLAEGVQDLAAMAGAVPAVEQRDELYDPLATPDVDKLNAAYLAVHGSAILGRSLWLKTSPFSQMA
ncbi:Polyadenylate-binding protein RBP47B' [Vitis vinifera]|uniref:Polyadenylate-binding protein RBP47B n=1 Tax=Vitis vinifera TaxID=29760 RepID=A0A438HLQ3_VITVI|nr:Polyadenylate-binding protein RBP47B' [Vitis vinifera]